MPLNRHGRIQNILATHEHENTDWFFNMVLCVFMVKAILTLFVEVVCSYCAHKTDACYASAIFLQFADIKGINLIKL